ncbi:MAG TPA: CHAT domain-containing protein [Thermoanaerobaculia bacterium]
MFIGVAALLFLWPREPYARLIRASAKERYRPTEARLARFEYGTPPVRMRDGNATATDPRPLRVSAVAADVHQGLGTADDPPGIHIAAVVDLFRGRSTEAIRRLERLVDRTPDDPFAWNDLAVAWHAGFREGDDPLMLVEALGAIDRARGLAPHAREILFNRALIMEDLGLELPAIAAWEAYLRIDPGSEWSDEARRHLSVLKQPTLKERWEHAAPQLLSAAARRDRATVERLVAEFPRDTRANSESFFLRDWGAAMLAGDAETAASRLWLIGTIAAASEARTGDTFLSETVAAIERETDANRLLRLAAALTGYLRARELYNKRRSADALPLFVGAEEEFAGCGSPMWLMARFYRAQALFDQRHPSAGPMLQELLAAAGPSHHALRANVLLAQSNVHTHYRELQEASDASRRSMELFERAGYAIDANLRAANLAALLARMGERGRAWRMRVDIFRDISRTGELSDLQSALNMAGRSEAYEERWHTAMPLLAAAIDLGMRQKATVYISSLVTYTQAAQLAGITGAWNNLRYVESLVQRIPDKGLRETAQLNLSVVEALLLRDKAPARTIELADAFIGQTRGQGDALPLPDVLITRAAARRRMGDSAGAERDLREALRLLDLKRQPGTLTSTDKLAQSALVSLLADRGAYDEAFDVIDQARTIPYGRPPAKRRNVPVVEYVMLDDRLLVFMLAGSQLTTRSVAVSPSYLQSTCDEYLKEVAAGRTGAAAARLSQWLLGGFPPGSLRGELVVVPDGALERIPFNALPMPDGRHLLHHVTLTISPSSRLVTDEPFVSVDRIVAVGNPALDRELYDLPPLPTAAREAHLISRLYPERVLLTGSDATAENFLAALATPANAHIAAHAQVMENDPAQSHLLLAPSGKSSGALRVEEIQRSIFASTPLVTLAACRTSESPDGSHNVSSLALAFLAAGARHVVGTLWAVPDDERSEALSLQFHRELRRGETPANALRNAQLAMIHSSDPALRDISVWNAFQLYEGGGGASWK